MKRILYIILPVLLFVVQAVPAQTNTFYNIKFEQIKVNREGNSVTIDTKINLDGLRLGTSDMIVLTPILRSQDLNSEFQVQPIVITGKQRSITLKRAIDFEGYRFDISPQGVFRRYNGKKQTIDLTIRAPYDNWVEDCDLIIREDLSCCGLTTSTSNEYKILTPLIAKEPVEEVIVIEAEYELSYITPPVEEVKQRSETHSAQLNFNVNKDVVERSLKNNAEILDEVDKIIKGVQDNKNLSGVEFKIVGYASPEGNQLSNMKLAEGRSKAFSYYLNDKYEIPAKSMKLDWFGDDWSGLHTAVEESDMQYKSQVLKALETINPVQRKSKLAQIAGGKAYRILLDEFYPKLRRIEYTISYVAKNFNIEEAKTQLKHNPQHLSLNEMFLVANTYSKSSDEFKSVFEIAARIYPDNPIAQQNAAAIDIENGKYDEAIARLESIESAEACNNIGVAYALKGELEQALDYLNEAITLGNKEAIDNKHTVESLIETDEF